MHHDSTKLKLFFVIDLLRTCFELTSHNVCNNQNTCESAQVHIAATEKTPEFNVILQWCR